jgi:tetratricopeptide (TPR) repeat protein
MRELEPQIAESCRQGLAALEAGRLADANMRFTDVIAARPNFVPALHALGLIARQEQRAEIALDYAARALANAPDSPAAKVLMARVLCDLGRLREAVPFYSDAADAQTRLEAAMLCERLGDSAAAVAQYRAVLALQPDLLEARRRLSTMLRRLGRLPEAEQLCQQRLLVAPHDAEAWFDLGNTLYDAEQFAQAVTAFRQALLCQADHADAMENLGNALLELGHLEAAEACLQQACAWHPALPGPQNGLGAVLRERGEIAAAESCFRAALHRAPDHTEAACNLATTLLLTGRYEEGWRRYEARWGTAKLPNRGFSAPLWHGEDLAGRTLLLHAEQGFGDTLQFCRFISQIPERPLLLEVPAPLVRLMRQSFPELTNILAYGEDLPPFDVHCPLMSLPLMLGIGGEAFVTCSDYAVADYLVADMAERGVWRQKLAELPGRRVGIVWQGNPRIASMRRRRDLPTRYLAQLADIPGLSFVSLQKGVSVAEIGLSMVDWTDALGDMASTAALVAELDLVIAVDTAVAHLAAGLGRPVWLLNRFDTCWRWLVGREDSPWYPSLRQFRQRQLGDWDSVMDDLVAELRGFAEQSL